jgi:hypothetical protein
MRLDSITLADLEVFRDPGGRCGVAALFAPTETSAGRAALHRRLRAPSADLDEILDAQAAVRFFAEEWKLALLPQGLLDTIEGYLASNIDLGGRHSLGRDLTHSVWLPLGDRDLRRELTDGVAACSDLLSASEVLARALLASGPPPMVQSLAEGILTLRNALGWVRRTPFLFSTIRTDRALRTEALERTRDLVDLLGELDALRTMGVTTRRLGWVLPELVDAERFLLECEGLYHPFLDAPTGNPVEIAGGEPFVASASSSPR